VKWNLHRFRNQELLKRGFNCTYFPDLPQKTLNPNNQRNLSTDTQEEAGNTTENPVPY